MILRKRIRHRIYKNILETVKMHGWDNSGLCRFLRSELDTLYPFNYVQIYATRFERFPEINKQLPKKFEGSGYMFRTYNGKDSKREKILENAIIESGPRKRVASGKRLSGSRKRISRKSSSRRKD